MNTRLLGSLYEDKACEYLKSLGYDIIERNYRNRTGEIDIIAKDGGTLVFTEVKYRTSNNKGYPEEAVNKFKQQTIINVARYYILTHNISEYAPCRFDVIACCQDDSLKHYINAFGGM